MKILITGASGFVGNSILSALCQDVRLKIDAIVKSRPIQKTLKSKINFHYCDLEKEDLKRVLSTKRFDVLIHAAWIGLPNKNSELNSKNSHITLRLFEDFVNSGGKVIVGFGTCLEYGTSYGNVSESDIGNNHSEFGIAKRNLSIQVSRLGIPYLWIRPFYLYGSKQHPNSLLKLAFKFLQNDDSSWMSDPLAANDFTYVGDLGRLIYALIESELWLGEINVGTSVAVQNIFFVNSLRKMLGREEYKIPQSSYDGMSADLTKLHSFLPNFSFSNVHNGLSIIIKEEPGSIK